MLRGEGKTSAPRRFVTGAGTVLVGEHEGPTQVWGTGWRDPGILQEVLGDTPPTSGSLHGFTDHQRGSGSRGFGAGGPVVTDPRGRG